MAKKPAKAAEKKVDVKVITTQKNRERRLARHCKAHPNDQQAANAPAVGTPRKAPKVKGNHPAPSNVYRDESGKPYAVQPKFVPQIKSDSIKPALV